MSSILEGYNYDIFISYRQKDNKGDRWVSEFVEALKTELESTFKEEISVYLDINPHDGLLETHDVDASLKEKLKCLVFIPIISRTYCDPKSFAWEHEFKAFVEGASRDQFGLKVKLANGNVISRVLPIRIHDLDNNDIKLCESVLGSVPRGIEFIYKEPGVNKPLISDDDEKKNLNNTKYRIQINKVANAIKEIITAIGDYIPQKEEASNEVIKLISVPRKNNKTKIIFGSVTLSVFIILGSFFVPKLFNPSEQLEKSVAVLPFVNDSPDQGNIYFINAIMDEVINDLSRIEDFSKVIPRTSVEKFRENNILAVPEIAKKLGVNYIVQGSGQKYGNKFILRVQLIAAKNEKHLLVKSYNREIKQPSDIISIQSQIAQAIAAELKAAITPEEKRLIERIPTANLTAYDFYQRGRDEHTKYWVNNNNNNALKNAEALYRKALEYDSTFVLAYTGLARIYWEKHSDITNAYHLENNVDSVLILCEYARSFDNKSVEAYTIMGDYYANKGNINKAIDEYDEALKINPNAWEAYYGKGIIYEDDDLLKSIQNFQKAASLNHGLELPSILRTIAYSYCSAGFIDQVNYYDLEALKLDDDSTAYFSSLAISEKYRNNLKKAVEYLVRAYSKDTTQAGTAVQLGHCYMFLNQYKETLKSYKKYVEILSARGTFTPIDMHRIGWAYWENGYKKEAEYFFNKQLDYSKDQIELKQSWGQKLYPYYDLAGVYAFTGEKGKAYSNLKIFKQRQRMPLWVVTWVKTDPLFNSIRNEPEFQQIVKEIEAKYQAEHERVRKWLSEQGML